MTAVSHRPKSKCNYTIFQPSLAEYTWLFTLQKYSLYLPRKEHYGDHIYPKGNYCIGKGPCGGLHLIRDRLLVTVSSDQARLSPGEDADFTGRETKQWKDTSYGVAIMESLHMENLTSLQGLTCKGHATSNDPGSKVLR